MNHTVTLTFNRVNCTLGEFSNFYKSPVFIDGVWYPSVEHWFQCQKTLNKKRREQIRTAPSAGKAAKMGRARKATILRADWEEIKDYEMYRGVMAKFSQHPELWEVLDATGDSILVEHTSRDSYWGDGGDGTGQNQLGITLMQVREELRATFALCQLSSDGTQ